MARFSLTSLRTRLLLLVLLAAIPALGLTLYTNLEERQLRKALVQEHAMRLARLVSADFKKNTQDTPFPKFGRKNAISPPPVYCGIIGSTSPAKLPMIFLM